MRVYANRLGYHNGSQPRINFNICILSPIDPPANNEYANATQLTVNPANDCTVTTPGTTDGATQSILDACHTDNNDDVWFTFTATQASHTLRLSNITQAYGTSTWRYAEVFTDVDNVPANRIFCSENFDFNETTLTGLTAGGSYFVRVYTYNVLNRINFNICILTPPIPANDECTAAIDISNGTQVTGTTNGATQSLPAGACASGTAYDVWYKATVAESGTLSVSAYANDFDLVLEAYSGSCASPVSFICKNDANNSESMSLSNVPAGSTYYFRVYNSAPFNARVAAETGNFIIQVSQNPLPVILTSFNVNTGENQSAYVTWATSEESNSSHFELEHSLNTKNWIRVGEVQAHGESAVPNNYNYTHIKPSSRVNYYRLRSVDFDGSYAYSRIVSIDLGGIPGRIGVYPNPVSDRLSLDITDWNEIKSLQLVNAAGREVSLKREVGTHSIDVRHLPSGMYVLRIDRGNNSIETFKVVISR